MKIPLKSTAINNWHPYRDDKPTEDAGVMFLVFTGDRMKRLGGDGEHNDESKFQSVSPFEMLILANIMMEGEKWKQNLSH